MCRERRAHGGHERVHAAAVYSCAVELRVGDAAPDFTLPASDGRTYTLSHFTGRQPVVLAWFPKAFTPGCTVQCQSLATAGGAIRRFDATYFMASTDTVDANTRFAQKARADFPILSDPTKAVAGAYGVLGWFRAPNRWTFYIDRDGRIAHIDKKVKPATAADDIASRLAKLGVPLR